MNAIGRIVRQNHDTRMLNIIMNTSLNRLPFDIEPITTGNIACEKPFNITEGNENFY